MRNMEQELEERKMAIDNLEVPPELENRLRKALQSVPEKKQKKVSFRLWPARYRALTAALLLFVFFSLYNLDVLAYYGKIIWGYDEIIYGSMKELNENGMGQALKGTYTFKNGTVVSLDGVMLDENKLVLMYTLKGANEDKIDNFFVEPLTGLLGRYNPQSGRGKLSDDRTAIRWLQEYESPAVFDKNLTFRLISNTNDISRNEKAAITFKLDRNKAVKRTVKCAIDKTVESQGIKCSFKTLSATPLSVVIEGTMEVSAPKDSKAFSPQDWQVPHRRLVVELRETYLQNGRLVTEKLENLSGGMGSSNGRIDFTYEFDGLKNNMQSLSLYLIKTEDVRIIDQRIAVDAKTKDIRVVPETNELIIQEVRTASGNTVVTFNMEKDLAFAAALYIGDRQAKLISEHSRVLEDDGNRREKVCVFEGSGQDMSLMFKTISHEVYINKEITIFNNSGS